MADETDPLPQESVADNAQTDTPELPPAPAVVPAYTPQAPKTQGGLPPAGILSDPTTAPIGLTNAAPDAGEDLVPALRTLPPSKAIDVATSVSGGDLKWALQQFGGVNPDTVAMFDKIARANGTSYDVVAQSPEDFKALEEAKGLYAQLNQTDSNGQPLYPAVAKWFKTPGNIAVGKDDVQNLTAIEGIARQADQSGEGYLHTLFRSGRSALDQLAAGVYSAPAAAYDAARSFLSTEPITDENGVTAPGGASQPILPEAPAWLKTAFGVIPSLQDYARYEAPVNLDGKTLSDATSLREGSLIAFNSLASMVAFAGGIIATKNPELVLGAGAASAGGEAYQEDLAKGKTEDQAGVDALLNAGSNYIFQRYVGALPMFKNAEELLTQLPAKESVLELAGRYGKLLGIATARGAASQGLTQASADAADFSTGNPQAFQDEGSKIINSMIVGAIGEGALIGTGGAVNAFSAMRNAQRGDAFLQEISKGATSSKLAERDPEKAISVINDTLDAGNAPKTLNIDAEKVMSFFQGRSDDINKFEQGVQLDPGTIENAAKTGGTVDIPTAPYVVNYRGSNIQAALARDFRVFASDGTPISMNEKDQMASFIKEQLGAFGKNAMMFASPEGLPAQVRQLHDQLTTKVKEGGFGMSKSDADAHVSVLVSTVSNFAKLRGESTSDAFKRINLSLEKLKGQDGEDGIQAQGVFYRTDTGSVIKSFAEGDRSTLLHEFAHLFLDQSRGIIKDGFGTPEFQSDFETLEKWAGGKLDGGETEAGVTAEERVAQGFEQYFREGKAPSIDLAGAFSRFRDWLTQIYRSVKALGHPINDDVRGVFDRILSTKDEISEAQDYYGELAGRINDNLELLRGPQPQEFTPALESQIRDAFTASEQRVQEAEKGATTPEGKKALTQARQEHMRAFGKDATADEVVEKVKSKGYEFRDSRIKMTDDAKKAAKLNDLAKQKRNVAASAVDGEVARRLKVFRDAVGGSAEFLDKARKVVEAMPVYRALVSMEEKGGVAASALARYATPEQIKALKEKYPTLIKTYDVTSFNDVATKHNVKVSDLVEALAGKQTPEKGSTLKAAVADVLKNGVTGESLAQAGMHADEILARHKGLLRNKGGGRSLTEYSDAQNFAAPEDLVKALLDSPKREDAVKLTKQSLLNNEEQAIRTDVEKNGVNSADNALHSDASLAYLISELKFIADKAGADRARAVRFFNVESFKLATKQYLDELPTSQAVRYDLFAKNEARLSRQVNAALTKGDYRTAERLEHARVMQHALVQASIKAREERAKILGRYADRKVEGRLAKIENAYVDPIRSVLFAYELSDTPPQRDIPMTDALAELVGNDQADGLNPQLAQILPEWLLDGEGVRTPDTQTTSSVYLALPWNRFQELNDTIKTLEAAGSDLMKSLGEESQARAVDFVEQMNARMNELPDFDPTIRSKQSKGNVDGLGHAILRGVDWLKDGLTMMNSVAKTADNYERERTGRTGPMERLVNLVVRAENNTNDKSAQVIGQQMKPHFLKLLAAMQRIEGEMGGKSFDIDGLPRGDAKALPNTLARRLFDTGQSKWESGMLVASLLNMGNEGNLNALKEGFNYSDEQLHQISRFFTKDELESVQSVWDIASKLFGPMDDVHFNLYNRHLDKVEPQAITLLDKQGEEVTLPGGYYPLVFDHALRTKTDPNTGEKVPFNGDDVEAAMTNDFTRSIFRDAKLANSFTKSRVGGTMPPLLDPTLIENHVKNVLRYTEYAPIIRDLNKVTANSDFSAMFTKKFGAGLYTDLRQWLHDQGMPNIEQVDRFQHGADKLFNYLRNRGVSDAIGWNLFSAIGQRFSYITSANALGPAWLVRGITSFGSRGAKTAIFGSSNTEMVEYATQLSKEHGLNVLGPREINLDRDVRDAMSRGFKPGFQITLPGGKVISRQEIQNAQYWLMKANDRAVVIPVWMGAFKKYMETIADPRKAEVDQMGEAAKFADSIILETQSSSVRAIQSEFVRNTKGFIRWLTPFMSWSNTWGNRIGYKYEAWQRGAIPFDEYMRFVTMEVLLEPTARYAFKTALQGTVTAGLGSGAAYVVGNALSGVPVLGNLPQALQEGGVAGWEEALSLVSATVPKRLFKAIGSTQKAVEGEGDAPEALWDWARFLGSAAGLPYLSVVAGLKKAYATVTGDSDLAKHYK